MNISVKFEFFGKVRNFRTLRKNSYFTKKFILYDFSYFTKKSVLYQKIRTLLKYSYFTESFPLYQKICTLDEQVHCRCCCCIDCLGKSMNQSNPARASTRQGAHGSLSDVSLIQHQRLPWPDQGKSQDVLTHHGPAAQQLLAPL